MIKLEKTEGRNVVFKETNFETAIATIKLLLLGNEYSEIKTIFEIPCMKGIGLHQVAQWNMSEIKTELFNDNFIITDNKNSLCINKDANIIIRDRKNSQYTFDIVLEDYHMFFTCVYK